MKKLSLSVLGLAAITGAASAQPAKLAWTRSNLSTDLVQETVEDALVTESGKFLLVGRGKGTSQACVTLLNRNRSVHAVWNGIWGDSSTCGVDDQFSGHFYVAGSFNPTGSTNQQIFIVKLDQNLNQVDQWTFSATTAGGKEVPTDLEVDATGAVYVCGWGENGVERNTWLFKATQGDGLLEFQIPEKFVGTQEPKLVLPEIEDEVFIAMLNNKNPELTRFLSDGTRTWTQAMLTDPQHSESSGFFDTYEQGTDIIWTGTWNSARGGGLYESRGATRRVDSSTGQVLASSLYSTSEGRWLLSQYDGYVVQSGPNAGLAVNGFLRGNRAEVHQRSGLNITSTWQSPITQIIRNLAVHRDIFGETAVMTAREAGSGMATGFTKVNTSGVKRWDIALPVTLNYTHVDWSIVAHEASGDILGIENSDTGFRLSCINQAAIALSDAYRPRTGITFRPPQPVTINDRWAGGASITITQQPLHGTLTMSANGFFNYRATGGFVGIDTFKYQLTKPGLNPATATVNLIVGA